MIKKKEGRGSDPILRKWVFLLSWSKAFFLYFTLLFLFSFICKYSNLSVCLTVSLFFLEMSSSVRISCDNIIKPQNNWMFLFMLCIFTQNGSVKTDIRMKWYSWKMWTLNRSFWRFRLEMYKWSKSSTRLNRPHLSAKPCVKMTYVNNDLRI